MLRLNWCGQADPGIVMVIDCKWAVQYKAAAKTQGIALQITPAASVGKRKWLFLLASL